MTKDAADAANLRAENAALRAELSRQQDRVNALLSRDDTTDTEFLRSLLSALPAFVARVGPDLRLRFLNRLAEGFNDSDALGKSIFDFIERAYWDTARQTIDRALASGVVDRYVVRAQGDHGRTTYYETIVAPLDGTSGEPGALLVSYDISAHVEREQALAESQERLRLAVSATGIGLWAWDIKSGHVEWNARMHEIMGRDQPLPPHEYTRVAVHPDDRELVRRALESVLETGDGWAPHRILRPSGEVRWVIPRGEAVRDKSGALVRLTGGTLDVTTTRELETRLSEAEKMEAVGTLTTGVAHNLNNLLAVIQPSLDMLAEYVAEPGQEMLTDAMRATERAAGVVRQLMTFAGKRRRAVNRPVSLAGLLEDAIKIARRLVPNEVTIEFNEPRAELRVLVDHDELAEVFVHLIVNARDALLEARTDPARISVSIEARAAGANENSRSSRSGPSAEVVVEDNAPGIEESVRRRVFEPFFTTKAPGKGTGLGLAISWNMVHSVGGTLSCESSPGHGTRFVVALPLAESESEAVSEPRAQPERRARLRVLLVEDNASVRAVTERILERGQHHTVAVSSVSDALRAAKQSNFDAVLLDQSLPDGRGSDVARDLRRLAGTPKILLFTGQDVDTCDLKDVDALLQKPLRAEELLDALSKVGD